MSIRKNCIGETQYIKEWTKGRKNWFNMNIQVIMKKFKGILLVNYNIYFVIVHRISEKIIKKAKIQNCLNKKCYSLSS